MSKHVAPELEVVNGRIATWQSMLDAVVDSLHGEGKSPLEIANESRVQDYTRRLERLYQDRDRLQPPAQASSSQPQPAPGVGTVFRRAARWKHGSSHGARSERRWKDDVIARFDNCCWICGRSESRKVEGQLSPGDVVLSLAHIVAGRDADVTDADDTSIPEEYELLQGTAEPFRYDSPRNRVLLCGVHGQEGTCHDLFEKHAFTILYANGLYFAYWFNARFIRVDPNATRTRNDRLVQLRPISHQPYRRALFHHATCCADDYTPSQLDDLPGYRDIEQQVVDMHHSSEVESSDDDDDVASVSTT